MSGKVRKSSPCSSAKMGPMRATLPMSSLMRQGTSSLRKSKSNSPTLSPTSAWKSPDTTLSGQRSPGSINYKAKSKTLNSRSSEGFGGSNVIRRTASLDTIYLNGQWPRQSFYLYGGLLVDKATQTEEWSGEQRKHRHAENLSDEAKLEKVMRHRRINKDATSSRERTAAFSLILQPSAHADNCPSLPSTGTNTPSFGVKAAPVNIPAKPEKTTPKMRSSIEGLNQEIERLVLKNASTQENGREEDKSRATPEGHRAPLADLLRSTRSVNTQTPGNRDVATGSSHSSGPPSRGSTPDLDKLGTSPHINKFLAREPPDGCEKISSKFFEDTRRPMIDLSKFEYCPLKPCLTLKPSLGSAFSPLQVSRTSIELNGELSPSSLEDEDLDKEYDGEASTTLPLVPLQSDGGSPSPTAPLPSLHD